MKLVLNDALVKQQLYPFAATRHVADIRIGILTIREKWQWLLKNVDIDLDESPAIPANIVPGFQMKDAIQTFIHQPILTDSLDFRILNHPWDIFKYNDWALRSDFEMVTAGRTSQSIPASNKVTNPENVFLEEGAQIEHCIINASTGPIYIGKNAEVLEGCMIRGPFAICEKGTLKMGAKVYGATTIGPYCSAAGEIKNSILFGYSNKAHDGYLGDSVIGEWCNLGAGTTNSNVKNSAGEVKCWDNSRQEYVGVGLKCGLLMGDFSRSAINTSFNTGTVVGVASNIFSIGFPPKFVPDFTWGINRYQFDKVLEHVDNWKQLKGRSLTEADKNILHTLYHQ